jgi:murein DD-endopeptidase MepM/ murein hydrolase activator NlpD
VLDVGYTSPLFLGLTRSPKIPEHLDPRVQYRGRAAGLQSGAIAITLAAAAVGLAMLVLPSLGVAEPLAALQPIKPPNADTAGTPAAVQPITWQPARGRECGRHKRGRRYCQGPRRVPAPHGDAAQLALQLGLGEVKTMSHLLLNAPKAEWIAAAGDARPGKLLFPIDEGVVWRGLQRGRKVHGKFRPRHKGIDIGAPDGTPMRSVQDGLVVYSDNGVRGYGNMLVTVHGDGSVALYAHCREIYVFAGQRVTRGQVVAQVGQTGITRGPHLHFEYRKASRVRDPSRLFERTQPVLARAPTPSRSPLR